MKTIKRDMRHSIAAFCALFAVLFLLLLGRLAFLQFIQGEKLQLQAEQMRLREVKVAAARGDILDCNGNVLATSVSTDSFYATPSEIDGSEEASEVARTLADLLGLSYDSVYEKLNKDNAFVWIARGVEHEVALQVEEKQLPGIYLTQETERYYPGGMLAGQILGFAGVDNQGLDGLEKSLDKTLSGTDGSILIEYDGRGNQLPQATHEYIAPEDGNTVVLTLDSTIQYMAEQTLADLMESEVSPTSATIVVMRPKTAEILAMANAPGFDPNNYGDYEVSAYRNRAVTDTYEPGSTFKIITMSAALEEGVVKENDMFYDPGYIKIGPETIKCWRSYNPHGSETFRQAVQNSCNPVFAEVALRLEKKGKGIFYKYIKAFGYGQKSGVDLPGEAPGLMVDPDRLIDHTIGTISIGQSIAVTPLQMVTAVSAVANGGVLLQPQIVKQVLDKDGNVLQDFQVKEVRRVISEETSALAMDILESVVSEGTGRRAYIPGYRVGGKTGTAQKVVNGVYAPGKYDASFIGVAPADDPQVVILVVINEPHGALYQGGQVAAPVFQPFAEKVLSYLGVVPVYDEERESAEENLGVEELSVPSVLNLPAEDAIAALQAAGFAYKTEGSGALVAAQTPAGLARADAGSEVLLRLADSTDLAAGTVIAPDLTGKRAKEAAALLSALGLKMSSSGAGVVFEQDPIPGTELAAGTVIRVVLKDEAVDVNAAP